jgi:hypothetical protein
MTTEFSVLPWLREIRDRHARETDGLSAEERVAALEKETHDWVTAFLRQHPDAMVLERHGQAKVAEAKAPYGRKR